MKISINSECCIKFKQINKKCFFSFKRLGLKYIWLIIQKIKDVDEKLIQWYNFEIPEPKNHRYFSWLQPEKYRYHVPDYIKPEEFSSFKKFIRIETSILVILHCSRNELDLIVSKHLSQANSKF